MKVLSKFTGKVNQFCQPPEPSWVTMTRVGDGQIFDSNAISEKLLEAGIDHNDCEFEVLIQEDDDGKIVPLLTKLEPIQLTEAELKAISDEVDSKLGNFDI